MYFDESGNLYSPPHSCHVCLRKGDLIRTSTKFRLSNQSFNTPLQKRTYDLYTIYTVSRTYATVGVHPMFSRLYTLPCHRALCPATTKYSESPLKAQTDKQARGGDTYKNSIDSSIASKIVQTDMGILTMMLGCFAIFFVESSQSDELWWEVLCLGGSW